MKKLIAVSIAICTMTSGAMAVSVGELISKCGDDAKVYCDGVGYGDAMTQCLVKHRAKLQDQCKLVVDRIKDGERVTLF